MKKVRRKLPPIPAEEELSQSPKPKQRPIPARKPPPRTDNRVLKNKSASSTSDDSSMNEDDKEVASITRKKQINNLDKPSIDKRNGNYLKNSITSDVNKPDDYVEINIPPDLEMITIKIRDDIISDTYHNETDAIIDSLINIYGAPITQAMKGLKKRLQDELRRVTEGRRRKIDEIEELRVLKFQLGELRIGVSNKSSGSNGKKRTAANSRTSPQMINRRARHKRQSSDPMVAKFSPIKEDKDIESEIQIVTLDDNRGNRTADDSSQSGISDTDSTRSEPINGNNKVCKRKGKPSDYANMFYTHHAQSTETLDASVNKAKQSSPQLISSHSDGNLPVNAEDEEMRQREEKRRELQFEIEKRRKQLAEREAKLKEARSSIGATNKQLAQSCDEISTRTNTGIPSYIHPRPIPTGIIKPIDDEGDNITTKANFQSQASYSSTEYLAHKQEEIMRQRLDGLASFSSPYLYNAEFGEKSAFVPQQTRTNLDSYSYSTGNVNISRDIGLCSSATLPNIPISKADLENNNRPISDTDSSPPNIATPAMPLLTDVKARSRKIIHEIGTGSRPVSAEFNVGVEGWYSSSHIGIAYIDIVVTIYK